MVAAPELYKLSGPPSDFADNLRFHLLMVLSHSDFAEVVRYKKPGRSGTGKLQMNLNLELILQYNLADHSGIRNLQYHLVVMAYLL